MLPHVFCDCLQMFVVNLLPVVRWHIAFGVSHDVIYCNLAVSLCADRCERMT